jgi:hypothetical protein
MVGMVEGLLLLRWWMFRIFDEGRDRLLYYTMMYDGHNDETPSYSWFTTSSFYHYHVVSGFVGEGDWGEWQ